MYIRIQWFFCKFNNISFNKYIYILNISVFNYIETNIFSSKINLLFNILSNSIISWIVIYILFLNTFHVWCLRFFSFMLCLRLKCFYIRSTYFDIFRLIQNHKHIPSLIRLDNRNYDAGLHYTVDIWCVQTYHSFSKCVIYLLYNM